MAFDVSKLTPDFGDPVAEARACRTKCALFDFSFLECARIEGRQATTTLETFSGRSLRATRPGDIVYAVRIDDNGRALADLTLWKTGAQSFDVMSGRRQDILDLVALNGVDAQVTDIGKWRATFSVQGPDTFDVLKKLGRVDHLAQLRYFTFCEANLSGIPCTIGRLGYTGEAGFEIIVASDCAAALWRALSTRARPAGFIAVDMLRIEAGFVLFTNEFRIPVSPEEAGLGKFRSTGSASPQLKLVSFRAQAEGLSWPWQAADFTERPSTPGSIAITSACDSVAAGSILGLGYVLDETAVDTPLVDSAAVFRNIHPVSLPFYDTTKRRPRAPWR